MSLQSEPEPDAARAAAKAAERVARSSYGKLVAALAARTRDVAGAEDALSEAFAAALRVWPKIGAPDKPEAWLMTAAKRKLIDAARKSAVAARQSDAIVLIAEELAALEVAPDLPDRRASLLFACVHPSVEPSARTPLMLQAVLGVSSQRIARAFLVEPPAMAQRLVRAKRAIASAQSSFAIPDVSVWPERLEAVCEAIYAAYGAAWDAPGADDTRSLAEEAVWLAGVLAEHLPDEPEALGVRALLCLLEARAPARRDADGGYIPLSAQDARLWRGDLIAEGETLLRRAVRFGRFGRFQLEAAIQSAHIHAVRQGAPDWGAILALYDALIALTRSPVAQVNRLASVQALFGPETARAALVDLFAAAPELEAYQPAHALAAALALACGDADAAISAYDRAIALCRDQAARSWLCARREQAALLRT